MAACALADPCGMEVSALKDHIAGCLISTRALAAKDSGNAHGLLSVADAQVVFAQDMLLAIESNKLGTLRLRTHHDLMAGNHVGIEAVHGLTVSHQDIVGDVHNIVDGTQADGRQLLLQPLRAFLHLAIRDAHTSVALASFVVLDLHIDGQVLIVDHKL